MASHAEKWRTLSIIKRSSRLSQMTTDQGYQRNIRSLQISVPYVQNIGPNLHRQWKWCSGIVLLSVVSSFSCLHESPLAPFFFFVLIAYAVERRVSKLVTNGSKAAVMDEIRFCVYH
jgi:hypothetical protein